MLAWAQRVGHARRLPRFEYRGQIRVFLTVSTFERHFAFSDPKVAEHTASQLLQLASAQPVEITAYCFMRDHAHVLLRGQDETADIAAAIAHWKQATGYWYRRLKRQRLWQVNYWDRVLRQRDRSTEVIRYIVSNPLRGGLAERLDDYPFIGSSRFSRSELIRVAETGRMPRPG